MIFSPFFLDLVNVPIAVTYPEIKYIHVPNVKEVGAISFAQFNQMTRSFNGINLLNLNYNL